MVEDDDDDRRIYHNLMVPHGDVIFNVYTCPMLRSCFGIIFEKRPDLVILDLNLPDSRGADTLHRLNNKFPRQKVLVVTGDLDSNLAETLLQIGAVDALEKSTVTQGESRTAIAQALEEKPSHWQADSRTGVA